MFKRYVAFFTVIIFIITMFPIAFSEKVYAYQNNAYFNNVKVGLVSMSSATITLTLNGDYTLNGQVYSSGSVINLGINGTSITLNGILLSQITLNPNNSNNFLIITSEGVSNKYMGSFLIKFSNSKILPINILDIENYLKGVVGYELSDSCPVESLKAQAVAARNYALSRIGYAAANGYDFDDTPAYQTYKGYNASLTNVITAVDQTRGQVLIYNDKLVETLYSAWHGGVSEDSENVWGNYVPYLRSVQDSFENQAWPNGNIVLTNNQIQATLASKGYLVSTDTFVNFDLNSITKFTSGRVSNINIVYKDAIGITKTKSVTNDNTRSFLTLPSNLYTVTYDVVNGSYTFAGKGNGHGLGMSQIGAKNRAAAGQTYDQILKFYYQNVSLQNLILKATLSTFTQNTNSLFVGNTISFNTIAAAGNGYGYLFKYVVKNGANTVFVRDYSSTSSLDFVPSDSGSYTIEAYVKDKYSISDYDDMKAIQFAVYNPQLSTVNSSGYFYEGRTVTFKANNTGASPTGLSYRYEVYSNEILISSNSYSTSNTFTFTPNIAGVYNVKVYGKDGLSTKAYDSMKQFNITINNKPLYLSTVPLSYGMSNNDVVSLQTALIKLGYSISSATGYFGSQTNSAVISFQNSAGIPGSGTVGDWTYNSLNSALIQKLGMKNLTF